MFGNKKVNLGGGGGSSDPNILEEALLKINLSQH